MLHCWLVTELKYCSQHGRDGDVDKMVLPFHSLINDGDQRAILAGLESGSVHYMVATICANVRIDMTMVNVVCVNVPHSFEEMIQWGVV